MKGKHYLILGAITLSLVAFFQGMAMYTQAKDTMDKVDVITTEIQGGIDMVKKVDKESVVSFLKDIKDIKEEVMSDE